MATALPGSYPSIHCRWAGSFRLRWGRRRSPRGRGGAASSTCTRKSPIGVLPGDPRFCFRADTRHGRALVLPKSSNRCPILTATATSTEMQSTVGEGGFCTRDREPKRDAETALRQEGHTFPRPEWSESAPRRLATASTAASTDPAKARRDPPQGAAKRPIVRGIWLARKDSNLQSPDPECGHTRACFALKQPQ
jgi:hypothetical protein